jgi:hypothetical protein
MATDVRDTFHGVGPEIVTVPYLPNEPRMIYGVPRFPMPTCIVSNFVSRDPILVAAQIKLLKIQQDMATRRHGGKQTRREARISWPVRRISSLDRAE